MKLLRLSLNNFQGIRDLEITPAGRDIDVYGENGSGKSTIANAISYLLFGVPANGAKNWNPKTVDDNGEELHNLQP